MASCVIFFSNVLRLIFSYFNKIELEEKMIESVLDEMKTDKKVSYPVRLTSEKNGFKEFGDIDWYKAIAFDAWNVDPESPLNAVINKLKLRYPEKFTSSAAINRDLSKERETLESDMK